MSSLQGQSIAQKKKKT